ncbi:MAG: VOC family protein [Hyphomicrobiaceae bacterium]
MTASTVTPVLRYRDPMEAADWLGRAFQFEVEQVACDATGEIEYIALAAGESSVLIGPANGAPFDDLLVQPSEIGGAGTQTCYLNIDDIDAHCKTAAAAGATIELEPQTDDDGSKFYLCRDPEGHLWSFGTHVYRASVPEPPVAIPSLRKRQPSQNIAATIVAATLIAGGSLFVFASTNFDTRNDAVSSDRAAQFEALVRQSDAERRNRELAERAAKLAERHRIEAEATSDKLREQLQDAESALADAQQKSQLANQALAMAQEQATAILAQEQQKHSLTRQAMLEAQKATEAARAEAEQKSALASQALTSAHDEKNGELAEAKRQHALAKQALEAALNDARAIGQSLDKTSKELNSSQQKIASLEAARAAAETASKAVARKLLNVSKLNSELREKLDTATQEIAAVVQQKQDAEKQLTIMRTDYERRLDASEQRLSFASSKLAGVASQLKQERERSQIAERMLEENSQLLTIARAEATDLAQTVQQLRKQIKFDPAKIRRQFAELNMQEPDPRLMKPQPRIAKTPSQSGEQQTRQAAIATPKPVDSRGDEALAKKLADQVAAEKKAAAKKAAAKKAAEKKAAAKKASEKKAVAKKAAEKRAADKRAADKKAAKKKKLKQIALLEKTKREAEKKRKAKKEDEENPLGRFGTACARSVWSSVLQKRGWSRSAKVMIAKRLCANAVSSTEPTKCFRRIIGGQVNWGGGTRWALRHALRLCGGSQNASTTLGCFRSVISANQGWRAAIVQCGRG